MDGGKIRFDRLAEGAGRERGRPDVSAHKESPRPNPWVGGWDVLADEVSLPLETFCQLKVLSTLPHANVTRG